MSLSSASSETSPSLRPGLRPLVILGAPRSGTKLLRDLLGQSTTCAPIPYDLNHVWRYGLPADASDQRPIGDATTHCRKEIRASLLDLANAHHAPASGYLVEKTCANTLRVPFVNRVLPDAHFVHIMRDGRDAAVSARKQWERSLTIRDVAKKLRHLPLRRPAVLLWYTRTLWSKLQTDEAGNGWGPQYEGLPTDLRKHSVLSVCARQWKACVSRCLNDLARISSDRVTSIRYESLVTDQTALDRVIEVLDLTNPDAIRDRYQTTVHDRSVGRWRRVLSPAEKRTVHDLLEPTLNRIGSLSTS